MRSLVRCKFYLMILLATVLFTVGTTVSDDKTDLSTGNTTQMARKSTVMILGSSYLANPGADVHNTKMDDVLALKRQAEIQQLVEQLARFKPTKIAVEVDARLDADLQAEYNAYLDDNLQLKRHEIHQIAFRLANQMGHPKVHCVDYFWAEQSPRIPESEIDSELMDYQQFAKTHNQDHLLPPKPTTDRKVTPDADGTVLIESDKHESLIDLYMHLNQPKGRRADHQAYMRIARIGIDTQYPGAHWVIHNWYARNFKIFVNLTRITESTDDRILLIIGAEHVFLIQQFLEDSGDYIIESPLKYLKTEDAN